MNEVCKHNECTGCAACRDVCPKQCITMKPDDMDVLHPFIDQKLCIDCKLCYKTCPNNRDVVFNTTKKVWAAWSSDDVARRTSASGGIAYELYKCWLKKGGVATGVVFDCEKGCHFILIEDEAVLCDVQNSKYTFSDTNQIYKVVKKKLNEGIAVLFIGVPCQVAGLYGFLKKDYANLTTVDIICHGMPPATYLEQHIKSIEDRKKEHTYKLFFRDPKYYTYTYTFTLYNKASKAFYKKKVLNTDNYQLGYHRALIYRENCYQCHYARPERIGDLTIGDFSGIGRCSPFEYDKHNVSCILQNTDKGSDLLIALENKIHKEERPRNEAFEYEKQLKSPSVKHTNRSLFEAKYKRSKDFEAASNVSLKKDKQRAIKEKNMQQVKLIVRAFFPKQFMAFVKQMFKR